VDRLSVCIAADWDLGTPLHELVQRLECGLVELAATVGLTLETEGRPSRTAGRVAVPARAASCVLV
jgi:hypothetical protein